MAKAKFYSFPDRKELKKIEKEKASKYIIWRRLFLIAFSIYTAIFVFTNLSIFNSQSLARLITYIFEDKEHIEEIDMSYSSIVDFDVLGSLAVIINNDTLNVYRTGGSVDLSVQIPYQDPVIKTGSSEILAYDRGSYSLNIFSNMASLYETVFSSPIISADINEEDNYLVITAEQGYKSAVSVYNTKNENIFKWSTSENYVISAALSSDSKNMVVAGFDQNNENVDTQVLFFDLSRDTVLNSKIFENKVPIYIDYLDDNGVFLICDDMIYLLDEDGDITYSEEISIENLLYYNVSGNIVTIAKYVGDSVKISNLNTSEYLFVSDDLSAISIADNYLAVLDDERFSLYYLETYEQIYSDEYIGAKNVKLAKDGLIFMSFSDYLKTFYIKGVIEHD